MVAVPLHNIVTKEVVDPTIQAQLLNALEYGEQEYQAYREERFIIKSKKLSATISKISLPLLSSNPAVLCSVSVPKDIARAHRAMEIVKERGMPISEIMKHDLLPCSPLFDGDFTSKPDKSQLVAELEQHLTTEHYNQFNQQSPLNTMFYSILCLRFASTGI